MPLLTVPIDPGGPIVALAVAVSGPRIEALEAARCPIPAPVLVRGLIDTGASCTTVDPEVIQRLQLTPTGTTSIFTPSTGATPHVCNQYDVALVMIMPREIHVMSLTIPVIEASLSSQGIQVLVGRDVLSAGILIYNGPHRSISLAF